MTEIELINVLLEKSKNEKEGAFFPKEVTLKISEFENLDLNIVEKLSNTISSVITRSFGDGNGIHRKDDYKKALISYSKDDDFITFFPSSLKKYLNEK